MSKSKLVILILCLCVLPFSILADQKIRTIEFIARECTEIGAGFSYIATDPMNSEQFGPAPLFTLHVPPMKDYDTIFFDLYARADYVWSGDQQIKAQASVGLELKNNQVIPENMKVVSGSAGLPDAALENNAQNKGYEYYTRNIKFILDFSPWQSRGIWVAYKDSQEIVPEEVEIPILKALIENGYDVEVKVKGTIQGVVKFGLGTACVEITRLSKN